MQHVMSSGLLVAIILHQVIAPGKVLCFGPAVEKRLRAVWLSPRFRSGFRWRTLPGATTDEAGSLLQFPYIQMLNSCSNQPGAVRNRKREKAKPQSKTPKQNPKAKPQSKTPNPNSKTQKQKIQRILYKFFSSRCPISFSSFVIPV
jgi:hypothetical protein